MTDERPMGNAQRPTGNVQPATPNAQRSTGNAQRQRTWDRLTALLMALASLVLYTCTAAPSVATIFDDSLEFHVVLPTLGIAHPSGYPLYTLLGKLVTLLLPLRDPAGRANLFSALCAAAAVGMLYMVARKIAGSRPAAATATVVFAISPAWWSQATIAEVYALHGLLVAVFLYCLLCWEETSASGCAQPATSHPVTSDRWLCAAAFTFGLGLTHHRMIALFLPATLTFILWTDRTLIRQPRRWALPALLALAPLLLYLYLPLRAAQGITSLDGAYAPTLAGTLDWILARGYSVFLTGNPFGVTRGFGAYLGLFLGQVGVLMVLVALVGLARTWRLSARRYALLAIATVTQIAFGVAYKVQDIEVFFIPATMLVTLWAAWGLVPYFDGRAKRAAHTARAVRLPQWSHGLHQLVWLLPVAFVLLFEPGREAIRSFQQRDRSRAWDVADYGRDILDSAEPSGRIVGLLGETTLVRYYRDVLGQRPDLQVVAADAEAARYAAVDAALTAGVSVYLTRDLPGAAGRYSLDATGPLIAVSPKATAAPAPAGQAVGGGIILVASTTSLRQTHAGPVVRVQLTWAATEPVAEELKVSARLLDAAGNVIVADDRIPVHFAYPTTAWAPGETVDDLYDLALPRALATDPSSILLILYRAADGTEVGRVTLPAPVEVTKSSFRVREAEIPLM